MNISFFFDSTQQSTGRYLLKVYMTNQSVTLKHTKLETLKIFKPCMELRYKEDSKTLEKINLAPVKNV